MKPVTDIIDDLHTSEEERLKIKAHLFEMQNAIAAQIMDYETRLLDAKTQVITAEVQGTSWLQRTWRPTHDVGFFTVSDRRYVWPD